MRWATLDLGGSLIGGRQSIGVEGVWVSEIERESTRGIGFMRGAEHGLHGNKINIEG